MITSTVIFLIWFVFSYYKINKACKLKNKDFSPFEGSFFDFLGFLFGFIMSFGGIFSLIIKYLP